MADISDKAFQEATVIAANGCMSYADEYADCVTQHRKSWFNDCGEYQTNFTKCIKSSPIFESIRRECTEGFKLCLRDNPSNPNACKREYDAMLQCARQIVDRVSAEGA